MNVLNRIEYYMEKNNWTKYRLSKISGIPQSTINSLFLKYNSPSISTLIIICNAFQISLYEFFSENEKFPTLTNEQLHLTKKMEHLTRKQKDAIYKLIDSILIKP